MYRFLAQDWCDLSWSEWVPLSGNQTEFQRLPAAPGLYRTRPSGQPRLSYIGQTGRSLRMRLRELARGVYATIMPYNDPHTAAPGHWAYRIADGIDFECSAAPMALPDAERQGLEDYLLWQYRCEAGESTLLNYGRFHARYSRSTNRAQGIVGTLLLEGEQNPGAGPCTSALVAIGSPSDANWMGLSWSLLQLLLSIQASHVPEQPGVYKLLDRDTKTLLYIGQSRSLRARLISHVRANWAPYTPCVSYFELPEATLTYQRHELESDLLGAYYGQTKRVPLYQYVRGR